LTRPIDIIRCFHTAFRRDISQIDNAVLSIVQKGGDLVPIFARIQIMNEVLDNHAKGEEAAVFPAIDNLTPSVTGAYLLDHRHLDNMTNGLETISKAPNPLIVARATAVLKSHLTIHLDKEDTFIYPTIRERTTDEQQTSIVNVMSSKVPPARFPVVIEWLFPLLDLEDQVLVTKGWMSLMPPQVFTSVKSLIRKNTGENWVKLTRQIPELLDNESKA
jgi:iron-sulfur cluster repair protein YtfE (RIC family)